MQLDYDFGIVQPGERLKHRFVIVNDIAQPLIVTRINKNCACTGTSISQSVLPGRGQVVLDVQMRSALENKKRRAQIYIEATSNGLNRKYLCTLDSVTSNILKIGKGDLIAKIPDFPCTDTSYETILPITIGDSNKIKYETLNLDSKNTRYLTPELLYAGNNKYILKLRCKNIEKQSGQLRDSIDFVLTRNNVDVYRWTQLFEFVVKSEISFYPRTILAGTLQGGGEIVRNIGLSFGSESNKIELLDLKSSNSDCSWEIVNKSNDGCSVRIHAYAPSNEGAFRIYLEGKIKIGAAKYYLHIPCEGYCVSESKQTQTVQRTAVIQALSLWMNGNKDESIEVMLGNKDYNNVAIERVFMMNEDDIKDIGPNKRSQEMKRIQLGAVAIREMWRELYERGMNEQTESGKKAYISAAYALANCMSESEIRLYRSIGSKYVQIMKQTK
ncbi:MAG: DUF1573 domain-containing protein [Candidatus Sumerlaeia bacterium]